jgi:hypothetical protein
LLTEDEPTTTLEMGEISPDFLGLRVKSNCENGA